MKFDDMIRLMVEADIQILKAGTPNMSPRERL